MQQIGFIKTAKAYVRGIDLLCFDHIDEADPECYGVTSPLAKSIVVGVQMSF